MAWNFTVSYVILAHAFSRAWTRDSHTREYTHEVGQYRLDDTVYMHVCICTCVCVGFHTAKVTVSYVRELLHVGFLGHMRLIS